MTKPIKDVVEVKAVASANSAFSVDMLNVRSEENLQKLINPLITRMDRL
jgi:hypothetical protein